MKNTKHSRGRETAWISPVTETAHTFRPNPWHLKHKSHMASKFLSAAMMLNPTLQYHMD